ncbi:hypothetical protein [Pedococcus bigeumensis]|uniref:hypothetical protein n=1 Tax=Pedococcus bigeumensis TaxID=433644 RepID=UPI0011272B08|nr:hypothetical protein [Pedococcus bigeumensis]
MKSSTRKVPLTGNANSDRGVLTHTLIATHAPRLALGESVDDLVPSMVQFAFGLVQTHPNGSRVIAAETVGMARRYLADLTPGDPWRLLGVEYETGEGPVDLAWVNDADGRVFFDEIKTSRVAAGRVAASWLQQCGRYTEAGVERFGDAFAGTRLLTVAQMDFARHMSGDLRVTPIKPTRDDPFAATSIGGRR